MQQTNPEKKYETMKKLFFWKIEIKIYRNSKFNAIKLQGRLEWLTQSILA